MGTTTILKQQGGAPAGGSTNQVLKKNSATDFDYGWGSGIIGNGFVVQDVPLVNTASGTPITMSTSTPDGSVLFIGLTEGGGATTWTLLRLLKDTLTGNYYITHKTTLTIDPASPGGMAVVGNYLYVSAAISGSLACRRYAIADLSGVTTISGLSGGRVVMFSDGTDLYNLSNTNEFTPHSISGTTLTPLTPITYTGAGNAVAAISDGTHVWTSDVGNPTLTTPFDIHKHLVSGGSNISTTSPIIPNGSYLNSLGIQLFLGSSSILGLDWSFNWTSASAVVGIGTHLMGITLP